MKLKNVILPLKKCLDKYPKTRRAVKRIPFYTFHILLSIVPILVLAIYAGGVEIVDSIKELINDIRKDVKIGGRNR
ncbi:MAG: hypothetical protein KAU20_05575 [Nanoarchaeota archaeon]|nr:hypothetical protein [Nanoarchaeota archaeon]